MQLTKVILFCFFILFLISSTVIAHRPVIVKNGNTKENPFQVKEPEISYAYFSELEGSPHYYRIMSLKDFVLYINILVPDFSPKEEPITRHDMSFQILIEDESFYIATGNQSQWKRFYEKYGRDNYYMGPEFEQRVPAGTYNIKVFSSNNKGKYALAIGKKESFTPWGLVGAMFKAWSLDEWFFKRSSGDNDMEGAKKTLIDFGQDGEKSIFRIVNDDVMGGISRSEMTMTEVSTAVFQGILSLENSGGFASVRTDLTDFKLAGYVGVTARIKGDGRVYQFRLRTDDRFDGISYRSEFETIADQWITLRLPFAGFKPVFRGQIVPDAPVLIPDKIRQLGFLIADKKAGPFRLEIDWIKAYLKADDFP